MYLKGIDLKEYTDGGIEKYNKNSALIEEGSAFKGLFYIKKGIVKILKKNSNGKELLMCFITEGDMIGITTFFNDEKYQFSAVAMNDCEVLFIKPDDFKILMKNSNEITKKMMEALIQRIDFFENWMTNVLSLSMHKRLAETLIYYSLMNNNNENSDLGKDDITFNYSIDELAGITGSSNSYVIKILQHFSKKKLIEKINSDELKISNYVGLIHEANTDSIGELTK